MAIFGLSFGANDRKVEWSRPRGFSAVPVLPIASLLEEYYLTDTIRRPAMLEYVKNLNIYYPAYDK